MTQSSDLLEIAQNGVAQIAAARDLDEAQSVQRFRLSTVWFFVGLVLFLVASYWMQTGLETRMRTLSPAVVEIEAVPAIDNPLVCPGDEIQYLVRINILENATVWSDATVVNLDTGRTELFGETLRPIYLGPNVRELPTTYTVPMLLPPTRTRGERPWGPGNYVRLLSITGTSGGSKSSVAEIPFRIGSNCPNVEK